MDGGFATTVVGLKEFQAELRNAGPAFTKELGAAHKEAGTVIVGAAQAMASSLGGVAAKASVSLRASASAKALQVNLGGAGHPEALGAEFGGGHRPHTWQFKPWRGSGRTAGYFLYPTLRALAADGRIVELYAKVIERVAAKAFPD